jgi:hypothetical protein
MTLILRQLLGRCPPPTSFYDKDSNLYQNARQICVPFYLEDQVESNEKKLALIQRSQKRKADVLDDEKPYHLS